MWSIFGVTRQNTFDEQYFDEFNRGGRPVEHDSDIDDADETIDQSTTHDTACETVRDSDDPDVPDGDLGRVETWGGTADEPGTPVSELLHDDEPT